MVGYTMFRHSRFLLLIIFSALLSVGCSSKFFIGSDEKNIFSSKSSKKSIAKKKTTSSHIEAPLVGDVQANICRIFSQKPTWYHSALKSQKKWNTPIHVMMAIMKQESAFRAKARPAQSRKINLFGRKVRPSSAYGYAQAQNGTWKDYQKGTGKGHHSRDVFDHAIYFIGWYTWQTRKLSKLKSYDTYNLYLAYHDGFTGFRLKTYKKKPWLLKIAKKVRNNGYKYAKQLKGCAGELKRNKVMKKQLLLAEKSPTSAQSGSLKNAHSVTKINSTKKVATHVSNMPQCYKIWGVWPFCAPFTR